MSANARDQHTREIASVSCPHMTVHTSHPSLPQQVYYRPDTRMYCSSSDDGAIKVSNCMCMHAYQLQYMYGREPGTYYKPGACAHTQKQSL